MIGVNNQTYSSRIKRKFSSQYNGHNTNGVELHAYRLELIIPFESIIAFKFFCKLPLSSVQLTTLQYDRFHMFKSYRYGMLASVQR